MFVLLYSTFGSVKPAARSYLNVPLAAVVIGGLVTSTCLTLLVLPTIYGCGLWGRTPGNLKAARFTGPRRQLRLKTACVQANSPALEVTFALT